VHRPLVVLLAGVILFAALAAGLVGFTTGGFASGAPSGSDSAAGAAAIAAHFPVANSNPETLLLQFGAPIWDHPASLSLAESQLNNTPGLRSVTGPLDPNGTAISVEQLVSLHSQLGPAASLPLTPPAGTSVQSTAYQAYRATAQFISADGRTVQFYVIAAAGPAVTQSAIASIPAIRSNLEAVARTAGAQDSGVVGLDAVAYDINHYSINDLLAIAPVVMAALVVLLAALLRSLIAPLYLIATVALSYVAALGTATFVFLHVRGDTGINFVIPILLFIFAMALGEDYNILLMTRVRDEAHDHALPEALARAV